MEENKKELLKKLIDEQPNKHIDLRSEDVWVNNSDGEGEDFFVWAVEYNEQDGYGLGVFPTDEEPEDCCEYEDFFSLDDLSDDDIEAVYEAALSKTTIDTEEKCREKINDIIENAWDEIAKIASDKLNIELNYDNCTYIQEMIENEIDNELGV